MLENFKIKNSKKYKFIFFFFKANDKELDTEDKINDNEEVVENKPISKPIEAQMAKEETRVEKVEISIKDEKDTKNKEMDEWDPAKDHFDSIRNAYGVNEESYEARIHGYG